MKELLLLIDGNSLLHRAYHVLPPLTIRRSGEVVGAIYGFASMLLKAISELKPSHWAIAFDKKGPTFRHQVYEQYKAHRPATPEELVGQLGRIRQLVEAFGLPTFELDGYEADDILGSLSQQAASKDTDTVIVTGDADAMQLVSDRVKVFYPKPGGTFSQAMLYDKEAVIHKYGVVPEHIIDLKALVGDPSDNIPGVSGIGQKTAAKLINRFGGIDQIYASVDEVTPDKTRRLLQDNEDIARKSLELASIVTHLPIKLDFADSKLSHFDRQKVAELFRELEFASLLPRLAELDSTVTASPAKTEPDVKTEYRIICNSSDLDKLVGHLRKAGSFSFDLETTSLNSMLAEIVGISLSATPGEAFYIPLGHVGLDEIRQLPMEEVMSKIGLILEDTGLPKTAHNGKYDTVVLAEQGMKVHNLSFDTMVAAHLLGEKSLGLKALAFARLGIEMTTITELIGSGSKKKCMSHVEISCTSDYACADADLTGRLKELFASELKEQGLWQLFADVEMPLVPVLVQMERNGIALDTGLLRRMSQRLGDRLHELETAIYENVGHHFNINSPRQLGPVLFEELKLPAARKRKTGYSTDALALEELRSTHPVIDIIIEYRQLNKLRSTYIDALPALVNPRTGRLHTSFNQTRTATGRLSSSEPNLQNIPVRGEQGREIRQAFIAPAGCQLLSGDYSQIDLRVLAHLSQDPGLLEVFAKDHDVHTATAMRFFDIQEENVTPDMRRLAKTVNFGIIYGMSGYGLEQATELSREEANHFITSYFKKYPGIKEYLEATKQQTRKVGYVETILGRRRSIPEINSGNRILREAAERMAINMPVQGTSADIIKLAMLKLYREMTNRRLKSKLLLQVHDELIFEVPEGEVIEMKGLVSRLMSSALKLSVPLKVDIKTGRNWGQLEQLDE
jgi:DNA polymerase-1